MKGLIHCHYKTPLDFHVKDNLEDFKIILLAVKRFPMKKENRNLPLQSD